MGCDNVRCRRRRRGRLRRALQGAEGDDAILVTGSLYIVADARSHLNERSVSTGEHRLNTRMRPIAWAAVMSDRTFVIIKPDAVERGLVGEIAGRFERKGLKIIAMELRQLDVKVLARHYAEHKSKGFYPELVAFMSRSPAVCMVLEGPEETWKVVRAMMGSTNPRDAAPGTIRGDLGTLFTENQVHGSDGPESAAREIKIFFPKLAK